MLATHTNDERRILLLEDDEIDRKAITRALKTYNLFSASLLADVEPLLQQESFDLILTDLNLPDSKGMQTVTSLLQLVDNTPIVILSGNHNDDIALEAIHSGAQDYIPKQYIGDANLLNRTLRHAIERHQLKMVLEATRDRERFLAHYDQCTSLPNRVLFLDRIHQSVIQAQRNQDKFALFFIDLDRFKHINDTLGHNAGDQVLRTVGARMKALIRDSDTAARFGGDEFVLIMQRSSDYMAMERLATALITSINEPIPFGRHQCSIGASIGIACYPKHGYSANQLIKNADMAMYQAKNEGKNRFQIYNHQLFEQKNRLFSLECELREALNNPSENFEVFYQARTVLNNNHVDSVEALLRWNSKKSGDIPPSQFIPLAEDIGLITVIDKWVLEQACKKIVEWQPIDPHIRIGINISGRTFNQPDFENSIVKPMLESYGVSGSSIEMEITESVLLDDTPMVLNRLEALKGLGINLAIDDFGTGFSSLSYLNNFPIDTLKIDGSFICDINSSKSQKSLLKAIIALGQALEMTIVAECVETEAQRQFLLSLSCTEGQGFYWGKPTAQWSPQVSSAPNN